MKNVNIQEKELNAFRDILKCEGINAAGYGNIPKMVMLDRKLTAEAKAIYAYFCSYAGAGMIAFPKVAKICSDLCISEKRYYKHFGLLKDYGYIQVEQKLTRKNKFSHNIYTMCQNPVPVKKEQEENSPSSHFACAENGSTQNGNTQNDGNNNNNLSKTNSSPIKKSINQSAKQVKKDSSEDMKQILENAEIHLYDEESQELVKQLVEDMYYSTDFQKSVGLPEKSVIGRLKSIKMQTIDLFLKRVQEINDNEDITINNPIRYFRKTLWNCLTESKI